MTQAYARQPSFWNWKTNVGAQKIYRLLLEIFEMVIASFQVINKLGRARFF